MPPGPDQLSGVVDRGGAASRGRLLEGRDLADPPLLPGPLPDLGVAQPLARRGLVLALAHSVRLPAGRISHARAVLPALPDNYRSGPKAVQDLGGHLRGLLGRVAQDVASRQLR